jgi:hypothetical protein
MNLAVEVPPVPLRADEQGVMRVGHTRVRLDTVITAWKQGASPEQIVEDNEKIISSLHNGYGEHDLSHS